MTLLEARSLTRRFGDLVAVGHVSLRLEEGEVVGLLGANGAGKTTLIRMLLGLLRPTSGEVRVMGTPATAVHRRSIGYVPQGLGLYRDLTVRENLAFIAAAYGVAVPALDPALAEVTDRRVAAISLGLQRRAAFAAALSHDPRILVLDEPTSGVGPLGRAGLWDTIHGTADAGAGVLVSTHYMEEAEECDRVVMLASGREVASGPVRDIVGDLRSVSVGPGVVPATLDLLRAGGAYVLADGRRWRVVGSDLGTVRAAVEPGVEVEEVPATFEEAFVSLAT